MVNKGSRVWSRIAESLNLSSLLRTNNAWRFEEKTFVREPLESFHLLEARISSPSFKCLWISSWMISQPWGRLLFIGGDWSFGCLATKWSIIGYWVDPILYYMRPKEFIQLFNKFNLKWLWLNLIGATCICLVFIGIYLTGFEHYFNNSKFSPI